MYYRRTGTKLAEVLADDISRSIIITLYERSQYEAWNPTYRFRSNPSSGKLDVTPENERVKGSGVVLIQSCYEDCSIVV